MELSQYLTRTTTSGYSANDSRAIVPVTKPESVALPDDLLDTLRR